MGYIRESLKVDIVDSLVEGGQMCRIEFLTPEEVKCSANVMVAWENIAQTNNDLAALFLSPPWWEYLIQTQPTFRYMLGVAPLRTRSFPMFSEIAGLQVKRPRINCLEVLGGQPMIPQDWPLYDKLFKRMLDVFPECHGICFDYVRPDMFTWQVLTGSIPESDVRWIVDFREGIRPLNIIRLPSSFRDYLAKFTPKTRYNLRRQVKRFREYGNGRLAFLRIEAPAEVPGFLEKAAHISENSWQYRKFGVQIENTSRACEGLRHLALRGILRSYLLRCGDEDCAFVRGFQFNGVFYYLRIGYDDRFAAHSPGIVLLYLMLEDLCQYRPVSRVNMLQGDAFYKKLFATDSGCDALVMVFSRTLANRVRVGMDTAFRGAFHCLQTICTFRENGRGPFRVSKLILQ
jgi:hypothetical protein